MVGAKTVKGPSACNASTKLAAFNATTRVEKSLLLTATSTIVPRATGVSAFISTDSVGFDGSWLFLDIWQDVIKKIDNSKIKFFIYIFYYYEANIRPNLNTQEYVY